MSSIDQRIVEMKFVNADFQRGVKDTIGSLESLKSSVDANTSKSGINGISTSGAVEQLGGMAAAVRHISDAFSVLGVIGFTVIQRLTSSALQLGANLVAQVLDPLVEGGQRRALNIEQAKFMFQGLGMDIEETMKSANEAVLGTAYGLDEAARTAAQFGATGMRAGDDMTSALRAVSGVAAMTGSSYEEISSVFITVAGNGRLMGNELLRLSSKGINAAATLAESMGVSEEAVRKMVSEGKISFEEFYEAMDGAFGEHATRANETYTGALANMRTALSRIGAAYATIRNEGLRQEFNALAPVINKINAALTPLFGVFKEITNINSGNMVKFLEGLDLTDFTQAMQPMSRVVMNLYDALQALIKPLREAFVEIFGGGGGDSLTTIVFRLQDLTRSFKIGSETADLLKRTFKGVFAVFKIVGQVVQGLFAGFAKLFGVVGTGDNAFLKLTAILGDWIVALSDAIAESGFFIKLFEGIAAVLMFPIRVITDLVNIVRSLVETGGEVGSSGLIAFFTRLNARLENLGGMGAWLVSVWEGFLDNMGRAFGVFAPIVDALIDRLNGVGGAAQGAGEGFDFEPIFNGAIDFLNSGIIAAGIGVFALFLNKLLGAIEMIGPNLLKGVTGVFKPLADAINGIFGSLTATLKAMQSELKSKTLINIATAVALLTASVLVLSLIDSAKLAEALGAMTVMFMELFGFMAIFEKTTSGMSFKKMPIVTGSMIMLAVAVAILAGAVKKLADLDTDKMISGLAGVGVSMLLLIQAADNIDADTSVGMMRASVAFGLLGISLHIVAGAVAKFAALDFDKMIQGLAGVGISLLLFVQTFEKIDDKKIGRLNIIAIALNIFALGLKFMAAAVSDFGDIAFFDMIKGLGAVTLLFVLVGQFDKHIPNELKLIKVSAALVVLGVALRIMADAVALMGQLSLEQLGIGLLGIAVTLTLLIVALKNMPEDDMIRSAAALVVMSVALNIMADALIKMGGLSIDKAGIALGLLAGTLLVLVVALKFLTGAIPGAIALGIIAGALWLLVPVLLALGSMSLEQVGTALLMLAGVFAVFGLAALVLTPVIPMMLLLGVALGLVGGALLMAGMGMMLFTAGLLLLGTIGAVGVAGITAMLTALVSMIPFVMQKIGEGIIAFAKVITDGAPAIVGAMVAIMLAWVQGLVDLIPPVIEAIVTLIKAIVVAIVELVPILVEAGMTIILAILEGVGKDIQAVVEAGLTLITNFLNGMAEGLPDLIDAAFNLVLSFITGVGDAITKYAADFVKAGSELFRAIVDGLALAIEQGGEDIRWAGRRIGEALLAGAMSAIGAQSPSKRFFEVGGYSIAGLVNGLAAGSKTVYAAGEGVGEQALSGIKKTMADISAYVDADMDLVPVVRPVLDLSAIRKDAANIGGALGETSIVVDKAYLKASSASEGYNANQEAYWKAQEEQAARGGDVIFQQTNNSPKALTPTEVYRKTKNLLATKLKEE